MNFRKLFKYNHPIYGYIVFEVNPKEKTLRFFSINQSESYGPKYNFDFLEGKEDSHINNFIDSRISIHPKDELISNLKLHNKFIGNVDIVNLPKTHNVVYKAVVLEPIEQTEEEITSDWLLAKIFTTDVMNLDRYKSKPDNEYRWEPRILLENPGGIYKKLHDVFSRVGYFKAPTLQEYKGPAKKIFSYEYFIPHGKKKRKEFFKTHNFGFLTPELVKNVYLTAKRILEKTKNGDYIVIFGNTPYFVGYFLKKMVSSEKSDEKYRVIVVLPFSGSPNRIREIEDPHDLVTPERLDHLLNRLKNLGLSIHNNDLLKHKIWIVDVIGLGSGPAYVIEELLRQFTKNNLPIPDFNIISLNKIDITEPESRNKAIAKNEAGDGEEITLYFPSIFNTHFTIDCFVILLKGHSLFDNLPNYTWRMLPQYNAAFWEHRFDYILHQPRTKVQQAALDYFDTQYEEIKKKEEK